MMITGAGVTRTASGVTSSRVQQRDRGVASAVGSCNLLLIWEYIVVRELGAVYRGSNNRHLQYISVLSRKKQLHGFYPLLNRMQVIKLKGMRWAKGSPQLCLMSPTECNNGTIQTLPVCS
jgi:hypothetical protein